MKNVPLLFLILLFPAIGLGATIYVPDDQPTIQGAINAAVNGDVVIVRPGTYVENIDFLGKSIVVQSERGAHLTVIDGSQVKAVVTFDGGETVDAVIDGFTLTNGNAPYGGGVYCYNSSPTITRCVIRHNLAMVHPGDGGGIACRNGSPVITSNMIVNNTSQYTGGGIFCDNSAAVITNNTICRNTVTAPNWGGGALYLREGSSATVANTILWDNTATNGPQIFVDDFYTPSTLDISYSDVMGGQAQVRVDPGCTLNWGAGMIEMFPLFCEPDLGDFHIYYTSPCLEAGDPAAPGLPAADFEGDKRVAGPRPDIGADEFYTHLYCVGDMTPGGKVSVRVVGLPPINQFTLVQGSSIKYPPMKTKFGYIHINPPFLYTLQMGTVSTTGIKRVSGSIPKTWIPGGQYYFQTLVGPLNGSFTELSNLMIILVQ